MGVEISEVKDLHGLWVTLTIPKDHVCNTDGVAEQQRDFHITPSSYNIQRKRGVCVVREHIEGENKGYIIGERLRRLSKEEISPLYVESFLCVDLSEETLFEVIKREYIAMYHKANNRTKNEKD